MEISPCIISPIPRLLWINSFLFKCHNTWWQPRLFPLLYFQGWNPQYYWMSNGVGKKINWFRTKFLKETSWGRGSVGLCCPIYETELISKVSSKLWFMIPKLTWHWTWIHQDWERRMMRQSLQEQADKHRQRAGWARAWSKVLPASARWNVRSSANLFECLRVSWAKQIRKTVMEVMHELENTGCV